jgi:hypothetical protein
MNHSSPIELEDTLTFARWEHAWKCMERARESDRQIVAATGMRAAKARDGKLLKILEQAANIMDKAAEDQQGRTRRESTPTREGDKVEYTEVQLVKRAYEFADKGEPLAQLCWIYGAAALAAGYVA